MMFPLKPMPAFLADHSGFAWASKGSSAAGRLKEECAAPRQHHFAM
jgi:hypothetical protein